MKKGVHLLLFLVCLCILSGCGCKHEWADATCTAPKTCTLCGKTDGEPLTHTLADATCSAPRTCTLCGKTDGEALPHTWVEANYQDPKTCSVCSKTEGTPLTASFEEHGLVINTFENYHTISSDSYTYKDAFDYVTTCYNNHSYKTTGKLYICDYRIFESDETHAAVDGYEWRAVDVKIEFSDWNANQYGASVELRLENYYAIEDLDNSIFEVSNTQWDYLSDTARGYISNYHGVDYPCIFSLENEHWSDWRTSTSYDENGNTSKTNFIEYIASFYVCVPVGYDGVVIGFCDSGNIQEEGMYIYDIADGNTLLFRLDNTVYEW